MLRKKWKDKVNCCPAASQRKGACQTKCTESKVAYTVANLRYSVLDPPKNVFYYTMIAMTD